MVDSINGNGYIDWGNSLSLKGLLLAILDDDLLPELELLQVLVDGLLPFLFVFLGLNPFGGLFSFTICVCLSFSRAKVLWAIGVMTRKFTVTFIFLTVSFQLLDSGNALRIPHFLQASIQIFVALVQDILLFNSSIVFCPIQHVCMLIYFLRLKHSAALYLWQILKAIYIIIIKFLFFFTTGNQVLRLRLINLYLFNSRPHDGFGISWA